ncbi:MAG: Adenine specific methylase [Myxococcaceae bacterium]|nr:Adenine specific methylase [Myxococcaceae bacterium]
MTELVWRGKYLDGKRVEPARDPAPIALRERHGDAPGEPDLLVAGDRCVALASLLPTLAGRVHAVYIDPPFDTGSSFQSTRRLDDGAEIKRHAYRDTWGVGIDAYLAFMSDTLALLRDLLADDGVIFVHCDWRANAYLRVLLDERFGPACFRNEIAWRRAPNLGRQAASRQLGRTLDTILVYSKTAGALFRGEAPRRSDPVALDARGQPAGAKWDPDRALWFTTAPRGDYTDASIARLRAEGRVHDAASGRVAIKYFLRKGDDGRWYKDQPIDVLWDDAEVRPLRHCPKSEDMGYDTQKPEGLLARIVRWATRPGDRVLDCFSGSGTTAAVAAKLGRRWVAIDVGDAAIATTRRRLVGTATTHPWALATVAPATRPVTRRALATRTAERDAVTVTLTGLEVDAIAESGLPAVAHWSSWVDYWLVDPDHDGEVFRARHVVQRAPKAALPTSVTVTAAGRVVVRVVDVLGVEASVELSG